MIHVINLITVRITIKRGKDGKKELAVSFVFVKQHDELKQIFKIPPREKQKLIT